MAIEITDEMRQAVFTEMCDQRGHEYNFSDAIPGDSVDLTRRDVRIKDFKLPHIRCNRCGRVWIVNDTPGRTYFEAEEMIRLGVKNTTKIDELRRRRKELMEQREQERLAEEERLRLEEEERLREEQEAQEPTPPPEPEPTPPPEPEPEPESPEPPLQ